MNYEEKYKEALKRAEILIGKLESAHIKGFIYHIFPELREIEDGRIKKEILNLVAIAGNGNQFERIKDWLEKQGEKQGKSALEAWKDMRFEVYQQASGNRHESNYSDDTTKMFSLNDIDEIIEKISEQNPADKVEPKFHPGDWIVDKSGLTQQVLDFRGGIYTCTYNSFTTDCESNYHLWTIQDAKDGDVLMTTKTRNCPFIYRKTDHNNHLAYYYAGVDGDGNFCEGCLKRTMYHFGPVANITPATKEQNDLLFQTMNKAGYVWDSEKKELKKIESKKLDADKVIEWLCNNSTLFGAKWCKIENIVEQFKKDFEL